MRVITGEEEVVMDWIAFFSGFIVAIFCFFLTLILLPFRTISRQQKNMHEDLTGYWRENAILQERQAAALEEISYQLVEKK